jgi:two-component system CheB/CheR fusion protein
MASAKKTSEKKSTEKKRKEGSRSASHRRPQPGQSAPTLPAAVPDRFFTVGIGASAGGLEAIRVFLKNLPPDSGMAFVLVPHLEPTHVSMMPELLRRETAMEVRQVEDGIAVAPNRIYVIPPDKGMEIREGRLYLQKRKPENQRPIDDFLTSLALDQQQWAIGILFSGMGSDGTLGLRAIIEKGGRTLVQDPDTAKFANMPKSAIDAGLADSVLPPEEMARQLQTYARQGIRPRPPAGPPQDEKTNTMLPKIFGLLRTHTGHDFSSYKRSTILRRIQRRMNLHQIADLADYVRFLQQNAGERKALFKEILIYVTRFFRDTEAFASLKEKALPLLLKDKPEGVQLRVWVIACSSGEEAYSIAMLLQDAIEHFQPSLAFQIFASDIDEDSVAFARAGLYPGTIAADVPPA